MTSVFRLALLVGVVPLFACGDKGITAPNCDRCDEMRVLTDRPEYRPGSTIVFTISNRTADDLRYDWCSVTLSSRTSPDVDFPVTYQPARRCGFGAGPEKVLERMVVVAPGESVRDSVTVSGAANQSQYQVHVWLLDANGVPETGNPVASNIFDVFPSAAHAISDR
jgi:hypothetical protein